MFWDRRTEGYGGRQKFYDDFKGVIGGEMFEMMIALHEPFSDTLALEAEMWYGSKTDDLARDLTEITLNLEEEILNQQKLELQPLDTKEKLESFNIIIKRIEEIRKRRSA
jgi:hypothetical protein